MSAETEKPGTVLQAWVPVDLAAQVKREAKGERRSVSSFVRHLIEDNFAAAAKAERPATGLSNDLARSRSGAGQGEDG